MRAVSFAGDRLPFFGLAFPCRKTYNVLCVEVFVRNLRRIKLLYEGGLIVNNPIDKLQFDRLAAIIDDSFGIADDTGKVLYSVPERLWKDGILPLPENADDSEACSFFWLEGFCIFKCVMDDDSVYLFKRIDTDRRYTARALRLVAYALENFDYSQRKAGDFFRNLLLYGEESVDIFDLREYSGKNLFGYTAIAVSCNTREGSGDGDLVNELLQHIFPKEQGFYVVPMGISKFAVICPLRSDADFETVVAEAEMIRDTLMSELMITGCISVGTVQPSLSEIHISYADALQAAEIGSVFELPQRCFIYDRLGIGRLIYGMDPEKCLLFLRETLGGDFLRDKGAPELLATLRIFFANNQNVSEAARALYIHRNTMVYRIEKFNRLTGLDCTKFEDGMKVGLALLAMKYLEKKAPEELKKSYLLLTAEKK